MKKLFGWCSLLLLAFIPLYPKLPLLDIKNTWVYVRLEDFVVVFVLLAWIALLIRKKISMKTPLTVPILIFWLIGGIATLHSILLIVPTVYEIYPNVAFLGFLRRIEYMSLFFVAYWAMQEKRHLTAVSVTLVLTVLAVSLYGLGQKYLGFPAYLTMNEEFAKGIALTLSGLGRISSTFGGHYDLAAFLVLTLPIVVSIFFGVRHWLIKLCLAVVTFLGAWALFLTVSRISFFALLVALGIVLFVQQRRIILFLVPAGILGVIVFGVFSPRLVDRFGNTIKEVEVLVDANTGTPIGHVKEVPNTYFENVTVRQYFYDSIGDVIVQASPSAKFVLPYENLSPKLILLTEPTAPTGEDLPSGTGYINLTLSPDVKRVDNFLYEPQRKSEATSREAYVINGEYLIKRAYAYDLSFTTRFQGEWPNAVKAFKRNIAVGSGYGSVSLAVDNSYLRMLAEVGFLGFASFLAIFLMIGIVVVRTIPKIDSPVVKSFVWGYVAGVAGLSLNAFFIDVFEASKVAFVLWLLTGSVVGILGLYHRPTLGFWREIKRAASSPVAIALYLLLSVVVLYSSVGRNYFIGDDFTWFRWVADGGSLLRYFTDAGGFFYRPGTKIYFDLMYRIFWLNPNVYHTVSILLHFVVSLLVFFLANNLFKKVGLASLSAFLFVVLSGFSETIFWISATGHLFAGAFMLLSVLYYARFRERKQRGYLVGIFASFALALGFHEMAVVTPLLFYAYEWTSEEKPTFFWTLILPLPVYALMRLVSGSHWFAGDYNVNLLKFPLNAAGNLFGYVLLALTGPFGAPIIESARTWLRREILLSLGVLGVGVVLTYWFVRMVWPKVVPEERKIIVFGALFSVISLLPFLGLGNVAPRYGYLAAVGFVILFVYLLEKLYRILLGSGRDVASYAVGIVMTVLVLVNSVGLHQLHQDWHDAGEMVRRFLVTVNSGYHDYWAREPMEFHFVNVPIRHRSAWVFPVGLSDAVWFILRNPNARVYTWPTLGDAFAAVSAGSTTQRVFVFDSEGRVKEAHKPPETP